MYKFSCPYHLEGCSRRFRSQSGRTYHVRTVHSNNNNILYNRNEDDNHELLVEGHEDHFTDAEHDDVPPPSAAASPTPSQPEAAKFPTPQRNVHPHINGIFFQLTLFFLYYNGEIEIKGRPCDKNGLFLPPGTPPLPRSDPSPDAWDPFDDRTQFRMGEFLYKKVEMSAGDIDELMDIWATSKAIDDSDSDDSDEFSPFSSHEHMYATIDEIKHGDAPWKSFTISYAGHLGQDPPSWQLQDYQVWYRDPDVVATNMLDNPDFDGEFDYAPYVEVDKSGQRRWNEPMSGNFPWRHAVHFYCHFYIMKIKPE
jgi:hypothetical protein